MFRGMGTSSGPPWSVFLKSHRWETRPYLAIWRFPKRRGPPEAPEVFGWGEFPRYAIGESGQLTETWAFSTTGRKLQACFPGKIVGNHLTRDFRAMQMISQFKMVRFDVWHCLIGRIDSILILKNSWFGWSIIQVRNDWPGLVNIQKTIEYRAIEIVDSPINSTVIFNSHVKLPEGTNKHHWLLLTLDGKAWRITPRAVFLVSYIRLTASSSVEIWLTW